MLANDFDVSTKGPEEEETSVPPLESVRQMKEICRVFKTLILEVQGDARRQDRSDVPMMLEGGRVPMMRRRLRLRKTPDEFSGTPGLRSYILQ